MLRKCAKDSEVKEDLQTFGNGIIEENETVQKVKITNRETNQKEKSDKVLASVQTEKDGVSYEKKMTLYYHKYDKGWELEYVETNAEQEWIVKPLEGVSEEKIEATLPDEYVTVDGESWSIDGWAEYQLSVKDHKTDLEKGTDTVTVEVTLDGDVEKATGTITADYEFSVDSWKLVSITEPEEMKVEIKSEKH